MSNNNKGASSLASVIQRRMAVVSKGTSSVSVEMGEIVQGNKLKLYSIPGAILDRSDYSVCECVTIRNEYYQSCSNPDCELSGSSHPNRELSTGDKVLIVWTFDGEPVVIDKIV